jgi:Spy/CpxP family protein refolding chaperone
METVIDSVPYSKSSDLKKDMALDVPGSIPTARDDGRRDIPGFRNGEDSNMVPRAVVLSLMLAVVCFVGRAGEGDGNPAGANRPHHHGHPLIQFILNHADALSLTSDQKTQLEELEKTAPAPHAAGSKQEAGDGEKARGEMREKIEAILTKDQIAKLKELMKEQHERHQQNKGDSPNPPATK